MTVCSWNIVNTVATKLGSVLAVYHQTAGTSEHYDIVCFIVCLTYQFPNDYMCFNFLPLMTGKSEKKSILHFLIYCIVFY